MLVDTLMVLGGLVLLPLGAQALVRGSTSIALRLGVTPLVVGLTIVAFGTGSPELALGVQAAARGSAGIAVGNVIGSNITNIALVLGAAALVRPMHVRSELVRREVPIMIAVTLALAVALLDERLTRFEGLLLLLGAVAYNASAYIVAKRATQEEPVAAEVRDVPGLARPARLDGVLVFLGLAGLIVGAHWLLTGAVSLATAFGVDEVVIGLTMVAIGTSLPELAISVTSAARGEADIAFGNAVGSNVFNILAVLGTAALVSPLDIEGLRTVDLAVFILAAMALLPLMRRGWVLSRWEGALLLAGYFAYVVAVWA